MITNEEEVESRNSNSNSASSEARSSSIPYYSRRFQYDTSSSQYNKTQSKLIASPTAMSEYHSSFSTPSKFRLPKAPGRSPSSANSYGNGSLVDPYSDTSQLSFLEHSHLASSSTLSPASLHESEASISKDQEPQRDLAAENLDLKCQLELSLKKLKLLDSEKKKLGLKYETIKSQLDSMELDAVHQAEEHKQLKKTHKQTCFQLNQLETYHQKVVEHLDSMLNEQSQGKLLTRNKHLWDTNSSPTESMNQSSFNESDSLQRLETVSNLEREKDTLNHLDSSDFSLETASSSSHLQRTMSYSRKGKPSVRAISIQVDSLASSLPTEMERLVQENMELQTLLEKLRSCVENDTQASPVTSTYPSLMHELDVAEKVHAAIQTQPLVPHTDTVSVATSKAAMDTPPMSTVSVTVASPVSLPPPPSLSLSLLERRVSKHTLRSIPHPPPSHLSIHIPNPPLADPAASLGGAYFRKLNRHRSRPHPRYFWVHQCTLFWAKTPPFTTPHATHRIRAIGIMGVEKENTQYGEALVVVSQERNVYLLAEEPAVLATWFAGLERWIQLRAITGDAGQ